MADDGKSQTTDGLQMTSILLGVQTLQRQRKEDKQEFLDFTKSVREDFLNIQTNFANVQNNFERMFAARKVDTLAQSLAAQSSSSHETASSHTVKPAVIQTKTVGNQVLHDMQGKELNLDGTPKSPYRHPHFGEVTTAVHESLPKGKLVQQEQNAELMQLEYEEDADNKKNGVNTLINRNRGLGQQNELRRNIPSVKPSKKNIPEFDGHDVDSWIQKIEIYLMLPEPLQTKELLLLT